MILEIVSPEAKLFVLVHKMDMVLQEEREEVFEKRKKELDTKKGRFDVTYFMTSIWEHSLYTAWAGITGILAKNLKEINALLKKFALVNDAEEVILFEKNSFLTLTYYNKKESPEKDSDKFERISHIIKKFKLGCMGLNKNFQTMIIRFNIYLTYLEEFTKSTYIMVTINSNKTNLELLKLNIALSVKVFKEKLGEE